MLSPLSPLLPCYFSACVPSLPMHTIAMFSCQPTIPSAALGLPSLLSVYTHQWHFLFAIPISNMLPFDCYHECFIRLLNTDKIRDRFPPLSPPQGGSLHSTAGLPCLLISHTAHPPPLETFPFFLMDRSGTRPGRPLEHSPNSRSLLSRDTSLEINISPLVNHSQMTPGMYQGDPDKPD